MLSKKSIGLLAAVFCFSVCLGEAGKLFAQEITAAEVITKHINSIGKPEVVENVKNRGMIGRSGFEFTQGLTGNNNEGSFICASEGEKLGMQMKFPDNTYPGEHFAFNGKEATISDINPGVKSPLGIFLFKYNTIIKSGFWGGAMTTAWPLLKQRDGKDFIVKQEKIKDHEFYVLEKKMGDLKIKLFFDTKTFRHRRTEYDVRIKGDISANKSTVGASEAVEITSTSTAPTRVGDLSPKATIQEAEPDSIYTLVENFDGFIKIDNLVLPKNYSIDFSAEGHGNTVIAQWNVIILSWINNTKKEVDQTFFVAQSLLSRAKPSAQSKPTEPSSK
jgi:hypothetical protein